MDTKKIAALLILAGMKREQNHIDRETKQNEKAHEEDLARVQRKHDRIVGR